MRTKTRTLVVLTWDEPDGCSSPRGWCHVEQGHPDERKRMFELCGSACVGNYVTYDRDRGPDGETVHACAYLIRMGAGGTSTTCNRSAWFHTVAEAKGWIEDVARERLVKVD
jgi:hypothetical protein